MVQEDREAVDPEARRRLDELDERLNSLQDSQLTLVQGEELAERLRAELREESLARTSLSTDNLHQANLADLPGTGVRNGAFAWVKNGRKFGEGSGNGTGVLSYFDEAAGTWLLFGDDSEVQT